MKHSTPRRLAFVALVLLAVSLVAGPATAGDYYFCFQDTDSLHTLTVTIVTDSAATGSIDIGGLAYSQPFAIPADSSGSFVLPAGAMIPGSDVIANLGVHVSSDVPVRVYGFATRSWSGDAFRALPLEGLGTDYTVLSYPALAGYASQFAVVATENATTVTVTPSGPNDSRPAAVPFQVNLNAGDVYQLQASGDGEDVSGTTIQADQDVAVFAGNTLGFVPTGVPFADHMATQLPPHTAWADEYIVAETRLHNQDRVRIQALNDGTGLAFSDGGGAPVLSAGAVFERTVNEGLAITASGPVQVTQFIEGAQADAVSDADPSVTIVPPRNRWGTHHRVVVPPDGTQSHSLAIVAPCTAAGAISVGGSALDAGIYTPIVNTDVCIGRTNIAPGTYTVSGVDSFAVAVFGAGSGNSYFYFSEGIVDTVTPPPPPPILYPVITGIEDVPNDQGRQVRLEWDRTPQDSVNSVTLVDQYAVYRRHDPGLTSAAAHAPQPGERIMMAGAAWDFVMSVPAFAQESYAAVVPTLADSTIVGGIYYSTFLVRAGTETPWMYFDSPPDSGYSVDNLEPSAPSSFAVAYNTGSGNQLSWDPAGEPDFWQYRVYRGPTPDFTPANPAAIVVTTGWIDPDNDGGGVFYKVTAVDFSGNESDPSDAGTATGIRPGGISAPTRLYDAVPNPFNPTTTIRFDLAKRGFVRLEVFDVAGRRVRTLVSGGRTPGSHFAVWDGLDDRGRALASGVYFYRLAAGGTAHTRKLVLLK